jgi:hypothetical protein
MKKKPPFGMIFMCALGDQLRLRALRGERDAIEALARMAPVDVPPAERRRHRDEAICRIAARLKAFDSSFTDHGVAILLEKAGKRLEDQAARSWRLPDRAPFNRLDRDERLKLEKEVRSVLAWGAGWIGRRMILRRLSLWRLEMTRPAAPYISDASITALPEGKVHASRSSSAK